jgi:glycosyltransferase involved in cell wall biosynthesis
MPKKILLIAYQFCPKGQIGTRRWSKFAKYLSRTGYEVHVLCARYPYRDQINWCHDVENNPNIKIHRISARYPTYVLRPRRNLWIKLFDRILSKTVYYYDMSQRWGPAMIPAALKLIRSEGIKTVVVTGPPFSPVHQAVKVKEKRPDIFFMIDFRDPWSPWIGQKSLLDKIRRRGGLKQEAAALRAADQLLFTTRNLRKEYLEIYPEHEAKSAVLFNGYDKDDFRHLPENVSVQPFHFVYTGTITRTRAYGLEYLVRAVAELDDDFFRDNMRVNIYGYGYNAPQFAEKELQDLSEKLIQYRGVVSQSEVFEVLQRHEFCLSVNAPEHADLIGAKTFDYMGLGKKIFLISLPGELSDILSQSGQYVATYEVESIKAALLRMKEDHLAGKRSVDPQQFERFEYTRLTEELMGYLA